MNHSYGYPNRKTSITTRSLIGGCLLIAGLLILPPATGCAVKAMPGILELDSPEKYERIGYPEASPSDPDIVAYTRREGNRRYLHLHHVVTGEDQRIVRQTRREQVVSGRLRSITRPQAEQIMREAGLDTSYFEGDFSWRPVLDQFGYQWFAFVATQAGRTQLHLGYVASGESLRSVVFPVSYGTVVTNPVFSPDGNALAFSVDGQLYLEKDIGRVIRKRDFRGMEPRRLTSQANGSFFPSWSSDGRLIAFQSRPSEGRRSGYASVFVIDTENIPEGRLPTAHRVSVDDEEEGIMRHHMLPSWAPSGRILAWYENTEKPKDATADNTIRPGPDGSGSTEAPPHVKNIRLVRVEFDRARSAWVGMFLQRPARRHFADPVYASPRSAPRWAVMEYDRRPSEGIIWVRYDAAMGHPLHFSLLDYYSDNRADFRFNLFSFSSRFEWLERTGNNRHPVTARFDGHTRFIWVAETDDLEELKVVDRQSNTIRPTIRREIKEHPAVVRSGFYPGLGHIHIGDKRRGTWMAASFTALAGATVTSAVIRYGNESQNPGNALLISLGTATAAVWTYSMLDLSRRFPAYRETPVPGTFEGYRTDIMHDASRGYGRINGPTRRDAMLLSALYPGLGQIYIGERSKGYVLGLTFTALAGSTLTSAAYRLHYPGQNPSNEVLIGLGVATFGTWLYSLIDVQQSFSNSFFAGNSTGNVSEASGQSNPPRSQIALSPRVESLQFGKHAYREYAAIGLSLSF
jgi:hypothetical protein